MPPRNPLEHPDDNNARLPDLFCYETMPAPGDLRPPVPPPNREFQEPCWCLDCLGQCDTAPCRNARPPRKRKAPASPEPREYRHGDDSWVQCITIWHPADFTCTRVEVDCDRPMRAIFSQLCFDLRIDRKYVKFVWQRNRRRGGVQPVTLSDTDAPWDVGLKETNDENIQCEYI